MTFLRWFLPFAALALSGMARAEPQNGVTAFVHVNVVPMDRERVLADQTVIVVDGIITAIGEGLSAPAGARIIDGERTAWLVPGLADMHNHVDSRQDLAVQLANGVTAMLNMGEARNSFVGRTRLAVEAGEVPGPRIFVALAVDGSPQYGHLIVATPEDARASVQVAKANGYDFIKVYNNLSPEVFAALAEEARAQSIPIVGHAVPQVGLAGQLAAGQILVAHAEEFFYAFFPAPPEGSPDAAPALDEIASAVALIRANGAMVAADLVIYDTIARQWGRPDVVQQFLSAPEARYLAPALRVSWPEIGYARRQGDLGQRAAFLRHFVKALSDAGVPLLSGTDAPAVPGLMPGFALHANLQLLEAAGLSRYQALATATRTPGELIARSSGQGPPFGTITPGSRADLLLVEANPLDDLASLGRPLGVMANGLWYERSELEAMLSRVSRSYEAAMREIPRSSAHHQPSPH